MRNLNPVVPHPVHDDTGETCRDQPTTPEAAQTARRLVREAQSMEGPSGLADEMTPAPLRAVGYIRLRPTDPPGHADQLAEHLRAVAARSGLELIDIYTEPAHTHRRTAFGSLLRTLLSPDVHAVIIPALWHLSECDGIHRGIRMVIEKETQSIVVVADEETAP
jgi:hypothetical protein